MAEVLYYLCLHNRLNTNISTSFLVLILVAAGPCRCVPVSIVGLDKNLSSWKALVGSCSNGNAHAGRSSGSLS